MPIWVAADRAMTASGEIDREIFTKNAVDWIHYELMQDDRKYQWDADEKCLALYSPGDHHNTPAPHWEDFSSVVADSKVVLLAKVTGERAGFNDHGIGVSVLRLKPLQWLKGKEDWELNYLQIPLGRMSFGGRNFCLGQAQFARFPKPGSRVVVAYNPLFIRHPGFRYMVASAPRILSLSPGGKVDLPDWVQQKHPDWRKLSDTAFDVFFVLSSESED